MKIVFVICTALVMLTFSCKKANDHINTPPVVTDTTKPPVLKVDTSTLLKSQLIYGYGYDPGGKMNGVDSELFQWTYDDQRRITQKTDAYSNSINATTDFYVDTTRFTYLNDRYIKSTNHFKNGSFRSTENTVYYLGLNNRTDSVSSPPTYFYYNQENQDSLEKYFSISSGVLSLEYSVNYFYTGVNLDSVTVQNENGKLTNVDYFSEGNLISQSYYDNLDNEVLTEVTNYTYTNIPNGELYIPESESLGGYFSYKTTNMISGSTYVTVPTGPAYTALYTYEQDAANRVTTMSHSINGLIYTKYVFTYY